MDFWLGDDAVFLEESHGRCKRIGAFIVSGIAAVGGRPVIRRRPIGVRLPIALPAYAGAVHG